MRSIVGLIINDTDKTVAEEERQRMLVKGFQIAKFPAVDHVVYADFPHNSFLSVLVAVHKIVPSFRSYIQVITLNSAYIYLCVIHSSDMCFCLEISLIKFHLQLSNCIFVCIFGCNRKYKILCMQELFYDGALIIKFLYVYIFHLI